MSYREWAPPKELRQAVSCLWTRHPGERSTRPVLPDGCTDLIWRAGAGAFVAGPDTGPVTTDDQPGGVLVGLRFRPGAGGAGLGLPLSTLRDRRVDAVDVGADLGGVLRPDLAPAEAVDALVRVAAGRLARANPDPAVAEAVGLLADARADLGRVSRTVGVSERQLRRRFQAAVGYGPKTLQRVLRFRMFLEGLDGGTDLADAAVRCGFADQPHLNRECRDLAGLTPAALAATAW